MIKLGYLIVLLSIAILGSCKKGEINTRLPEGLRGVWVEQLYEEGIFTYGKSSDFDENLPGIEFKSSGTFVQRANSGFCGTPPISYANFEGNWNDASEGRYNVEVAYWGGTQNYRIEILSLIGDEMKAKFIYPDDK